MSKRRGKCGVPGGAARHYREGTPVCEPCREAIVRYRRAWRASRNGTPMLDTPIGKQRRTRPRIVGILDAHPNEWFTIRGLQDELEHRFGHRWHLDTVRRQVQRMVSYGMVEKRYVDVPNMASTSGYARVLQVRLAQTPAPNEWYRLKWRPCEEVPA